MEIEEIREFLGQFKKKRGIFDLHAIQCSDGILFYLVLPKEVWNVEADAPHKTGGSYFLVEMAKEIAASHKWSVAIQHASPEDDPSCVDSWCEASKILKGPVSKEEIVALVEEANDILEKINRAIAKSKRKNTRRLSKKRRIV